MLRSSFVGAKDPLRQSFPSAFESWLGDCARTYCSYMNAKFDNVSSHQQMEGQRRAQIRFIK